MCHQLKRKTFMRGTSHIHCHIIYYVVDKSHGPCGSFSIFIFIFLKLLFLIYGLILQVKIHPY